MSKKLKIYDVKWTSTTAGPSPDNNRRTEIFLWGCESAANGFACEGCFNPEMWKTSPSVIGFTPQDVADNIDKHAPNRFVTIVGGEPLDQLEGLSELCYALKQHGFHIILFSHWKLEEITTFELNENPEMTTKLLRNIDILVDGKYDYKQRIYDESSEDGLHDAVGSGNQVIWDFQNWNWERDHGKINCSISGMKAGDLEGIYVEPNGILHYITKTEEAAYEEAEGVA